MLYQVLRSLDTLTCFRISRTARDSQGTCCGCAGVVWSHLGKRSSVVLNGPNACEDTSINHRKRAKWHINRTFFAGQRFWEYCQWKTSGEALSSHPCVMFWRHHDLATIPCTSVAVKFLCIMAAILREPDIVFMALTTRQPQEML